MNIKFNFQRFDRNWHAGDGGVIVSGHKPITGPKFRVADLLGEIKRLGGETRAVWYKRFIFYFPSSAWWSLDIAIVRSI